MITIIMSLLGIAAAVILVSMVGLAIRQGRALFNGDEEEFDRLTIPYDIAEALALRDFGISKEVFELTWNELKESNSNALPYDVYLYFKNNK